MCFLAQKQEGTIWNNLGGICHTIEGDTGTPTAYSVGGYVKAGSHMVTFISAKDWKSTTRETGIVLGHKQGLVLDPSEASITKVHPDPSLVNGSIPLA